MTNLTTTPPHDLQLTQARPLDQNPAAVYLASLGENSRRPMRIALDAIARLLAPLREGLGAPDCFTLDWAALRFQHTAAIRARLADSGKAPATVNRELAALKGTLKAAWRLGQMAAEDYQRAADLDPIHGSRLPAGRELTPGEIAAIMQACESAPAPGGARDAALFAVNLAAGLRRAEVVGLNWQDYDQAAGQLVIRGKGNKERICHLVNGAADALADWLQLRGEDPGPLFWPVNKGGHMIPGDRLDAQSVYDLYERLAMAAGVAPFTPHDLRRTWVSQLLAAGADISTVARMAGHASVTTTARYDRRPEEAKRKAAGLLHVPYHRRGVK